MTDTDEDRTASVFKSVIQQVVKNLAQVSRIHADPNAMAATVLDHENAFVFGGQEFVGFEKVGDERVPIEGDQLWLDVAVFGTCGGMQAVNELAQPDQFVFEGLGELRGQ